MPGWTFAREVMLAALAQHPWRAALAALAIALGVALGFAVQTIHTAAVDALALSVRTISGEADLELRGPRNGFDESLYATLAQFAEVAGASPVVEVEAPLDAAPRSLRVLGIDAFRAAEIAPGLVPEPSARLELLEPDAVFLSVTAAQALGLGPGDTLRLRSGLRSVTLRVRGLLPAATVAEMAVMDIAAAQQAFDRYGSVSRIDLRLAGGTDIDAFRDRLGTLLPPGVAATRPASAITAGASVSRAYRVNLQVLALMALFTGGLLVFSTQTLAVVRRRPEFALLRVLGLTRGQLLSVLVGEAALLGLVGSVAGLAVGYGLAAAALRVLGADLGSGYFADVAVALPFSPAAAAVFLCLGTGIAVAGSAVPAIEAARARPAAALKAGDEQEPFRRLRAAWPGVLTLVLGGAAAFAPAIAGLPLFGYTSILLLLVGALMVMPRTAHAVLHQVPPLRNVSWWLALAQLRGAPGQATVSLAAIVASVSLMTSMGIMVHSFRGSLEHWLDRVLPADLYVRAGMAGDSAALSPEVQRELAALPALRRIEFTREQQVLLDPTRPRVTVIARDLDPAAAMLVLPLVAEAPPGAVPGAPPVWVNEAAAALYGFVPGRSITLALGGRSVEFSVAGVWRDYARQQGALVIERSRYIAVTHDREATSAAAWLAPDGTLEAAREAILRHVRGGDRLDIAVPGEIRAASLRAFDRTFAVTYALELAAIVIGLIGLSSAFGALVLSRRREFGVLRHLGLRRGEVGAMLAIEGMLVTGIGLATGLVAGWLMSLVLVHVVNRQSFHWGMELDIPWAALAGGVVIMLVLAIGTALASARAAMTGDVVRAVREDW